MAKIIEENSVNYFESLFQLRIISNYKKYLPYLALLILVALIFFVIFSMFNIKETSPPKDIYWGKICRQPPDTTNKALFKKSYSGVPGDKINVSKIVYITMDDTMKFNPSYIQVGSNQTIKFVVKNFGKLKHEFVIGMKSDLISHQKEMLDNPSVEHRHSNMVHLKPGNTGELLWKFTHSGAVPFACLQAGHMESGMHGIVLVNLQ